MNYAYLHGFARDETAPKGRRLSDVFRQHGVQLRRPNLNQPSFCELTYSGMLRTLDEMDAAAGDEPWRFIGSSRGGYAAARWAQLNPGRVDRMVLLAPAFDMLEVWAEMLGEHLLEEWRREGEFLFFGPDDNLQPVHWQLFADVRDNHPGYPDVEVPTRVIHGCDDELVPVEKSRNFVERTPAAQLVCVDDSHDLGNSVWRVVREALDFLSSSQSAYRRTRTRFGAK